MGRNRGFTLIELMVYVALLAIVLNLLGRILTSSTDSLSALRRQADGLSWALSAIDTFKEDVRNASEARLALDATTSMPTLILTRPAADLTVQYEAIGTTFVRRVTERDRVIIRRLPFKTDATELKLDGVCVTVTIDLPSSTGRLKGAHVISATAALRCPKAAQEAP